MPPKKQFIGEPSTSTKRVRLHRQSETEAARERRLADQRIRQSQLRASQTPEQRAEHNRIRRMQYSQATTSHRRQVLSRMDETEDGELETCQQVNLKVVKVEDSSVDIKPPPDSVPGIIATPGSDISTPLLTCKLEPHADNTIPSSPLGQPLFVPLNAGGLVPQVLQPVCVVPGGSSTLTQPYFITPQGLSVQNGRVHGVGFALTAAPGAQPAPLPNFAAPIAADSSFPTVASTFSGAINPSLTTVASTTLFSAHTELSSTKGGPKEDDVLSKMDEIVLKSESEDGELETCQQFSIKKVNVEDISIDINSTVEPVVSCAVLTESSLVSIEPPPDAEPGILSTPDVSTPPNGCNLKELPSNTNQLSELHTTETNLNPIATSSRSPTKPAKSLRGKRKRARDSEFLEAVREMEERNADILRQRNEQQKRLFRMVLEHEAREAAEREREFAFIREEAAESRRQQAAFQQGFLAIFQQLVNVLDKRNAPASPPVD